jgi:YbbR domain-containing protein
MDAEGSPVAQVSLEPSVVKVRVELAQRANFRPSVPIRVQLVGEVAPLYWVSNILVQPASVTLVGLPSVLEEVPGYIETEPVDITGATATVSQRVALRLPAGVSVVPETAQTEASQTVQVQVEVQPVTGGQTFQVPVNMQGLAPQFTATLSPEVVDVFLSGPLVQLQALDPAQIEVTVNLLDLSEGSHQVTPTVIVPPGIELKGMVPEAVAVEIVGPAPTPTIPPPAETATPAGSG